MPINSKRQAAWGSSDALSNVYHTSFGVPVMMNLSIYYVLLRYMANGAVGFKFPGEPQVVGVLRTLRSTPGLVGKLGSGG